MSQAVRDLVIKSDEVDYSPEYWNRLFRLPANITAVCLNYSLKLKESLCNETNFKRE